MGGFRSRLKYGGDGKWTPILVLRVRWAQGTSVPGKTRSPMRTRRLNTGPLGGRVNMIAPVISKASWIFILRSAIVSEWRTKNGCCPVSLPTNSHYNSESTCQRRYTSCWRQCLIRLAIGYLGTFIVSRIVGRIAMRGERYGRVLHGRVFRTVVKVHCV